MDSFIPLLWARISSCGVNLLVRGLVRFLIFILLVFYLTFSPSENRFHIVIFTLDR